MLSRLALARVTPRVSLGARCTATVPTTVGRPGCPPGREVLEGYDGPERDVVNFPRLKRPLYPGKVRMGVFPDEWFQLLYPKTGVTGPYLFGTGLVSYLYSKEWLVTDHEFYVGIAFIYIFYMATKKLGPSITKLANDEMEIEEKEAKQGFEQEMKFHETTVSDCEKRQWQYGSVYQMISGAQKENVDLQLEAEFRKRQMQAYSEVKKRLDYQLELINIQRRLQQKHMVDWVVSNVLKSISPKQEKETLSKCIADLKGLAATA